MGGMVPALQAVVARYEGQIFPGDMFALEDLVERSGWSASSTLST